MYRLPLSERQRHARNKRALYRASPDYRLHCVNKERARRGKPPVTAEELGEPRNGVIGAPRDERGRFA